MFPPCLLPDVEGLQVEQFVVEPSGICLTIVATTAAASCPVCEMPSHRIQSRYTRLIADLPWAGVAVHLRLHVRRFFCTNPACRRAIFCERLGLALRAFARRTTRLESTLRLLGFALGGEAGARQLIKLGMSASPTTLLRLLRNASTPPMKTPRLLGVDDWAWRKGRSYGTILCDLEQHRVVDLLPDRLAETFATWLRNHPGVEVISRDRASGYAEGARAGAPHAIQVADRWHLFKNLSDTLERLLHQALARQKKTRGHPPKASQPIVREARLTPAQQLRRAQRQACYAQVRALYEQGWSLRAIAHDVGIDRGTVAYFVRHEVYPELKRSRKRSRRTGQLDPYLPYLQERWQAGCHNGMKLWREIRGQGYPGSASSVRPYIALLRQDPSVPLSQLTPERQPRPPAGLSPQRVVSLALRLATRLSAGEQAELDHFAQTHEELSPAITLAQTFAQMVREQCSKVLVEWIAQAQTSPWPELRQFARGIAEDKAAVMAALSRPESNGQTEGHVNRLKLIKREMYGRAKFDLLRLRVLYAA